MTRGARRVAIVVYDGVQSLDVVGPAEVFAMASEHAGAARVVGYEVVVDGRQGGAHE